MARPEKRELCTHHRINQEQLCFTCDAYNDAIENCRDYYESPEYIQQLIDESKVVVDEKNAFEILQDAHFHIVNYLLVQRLAENSKKVIKVGGEK